MYSVRKYDEMKSINYYFVVLPFFGDLPILVESAQPLAGKINKLINEEKWTGS